MKLQRVVNLKAYGKTYYKWLLTLPPTLIEELGWNEGDELAGKADRGVLRLRRTELTSVLPSGSSGRQRRESPK